MGRLAIVLLVCCLGLGVFLIGAVAVSGGRVLGRGRGPDDLTIIETGRVSYSAVVRPDGRATTAYFEYGLGTRYREPRPSAVVYDESTPLLHLPADLGSHHVFGRASRLVPNAVYHVRLVAFSRAGTVQSPDSAFKTAQDPPPRMPRIGATLNLEPNSGLVLIQPPRPNSGARIARLIAGTSFLPLTEKRQLSIDGQIDARAGALTMVVASPQPRRTQRVRLTGGLLSVAQPRSGPDRGLTTLALHDNEFPGAPTYTACTPGLANGPVVQTLHANDLAGRFRTRATYSAATASGAGTVWDTVEGCDGTLTVVDRGTVTVSDFRLGTTVALQAGQSYLAAAP